MSIARDRYDRRILPRWHPSTQLGEIYELLPVRVVKPLSPSNDNRSLREAEYQFARNPTIGHAADLFSTAIVSESAEGDIDRAARYLMQRAGELSPSLRNVVEHYTHGAQHFQPSAPQNLQTAVAEARRTLQINPRNALVWSDLARHYAAASNKKKAIKHMQVALALAPNHRWMIRAAVRCFVHCDDPVRAHRLLVQHPRTKQDPWLIAAELATAQVAKRPPKYWRQANHMLQWEGLRPEHLSELSTAVAMYELESDGARRARKHLGKGLLLPTENALAQVSWAVQQKHLKGVDNIDDLVESNQNAHEAEFQRRAAVGDYLVAMEACRRWSESEPFAARPNTGLAYLSSILDDYEGTIHYANRVLALDGKLDLTTQLNFIYAELSSGAAEDPDKSSLIGRALFDLMREAESTHLYANLGLWCYRSGKPKEGREHYEKSITLSLKQGALEQASMASVFFSRESILLGEPDAAEQLVKATQLAERARNKAAAFYVKKLSALIKEPEKVDYFLSPNSAPEFIEQQTRIVTPAQKIKLIRGERGPIALVSKSLPRLNR